MEVTNVNMNLCVTLNLTTASDEVLANIEAEIRAERKRRYIRDKTANIGTKQDACNFLDRCATVDAVWDEDVIEHCRKILSGTDSKKSKQAAKAIELAGDLSNLASEMNEPKLYADAQEREHARDYKKLMKLCKEEWGYSVD